MEWLPGPSNKLTVAVPPGVKAATPKTAEPRHEGALASQNVTSPGVTKFPEEVTVAVAVTGVPADTEFTDKLNTVDVESAVTVNGTDALAGV